MNSILRTFPTAASIGRGLVKGVAVAVFQLPERALDLLIVWERRIAARQALVGMEPHLLDDMGIVPEDAARESQKPFWRA